MKKFFTFVLIVGILVGGYVGVKKFINYQSEQKRIEEIKKGWYVEVTTKELNVRKDHDKYSASLGKVSKGDIFAVQEVYTGGVMTWYKIEYHGKYAGETGWIANDSKHTYLKDVNSPKDVYKPTLKFNDAIYYVNSIDDINYDNLEVWDDKPDYKVSHVVYHEVDEYQGIDQYWIRYTVTDGAGNETSKTQKIVFTVKPSENKVVDFSKYPR